MNRRGFLQGLIASGIAAPIASKLSYAFASEEGAKSCISNLLSVNGEVLSFGAQEEGDGWYKIYKTFVQDPKVSSLIKVGDIGSKDYYVGYTTFSNPQVETDDNQTYTASAYVKITGEDSMEVRDIGLYEKEREDKYTKTS